MWLLFLLFCFQRSSVFDLIMAEEESSAPAYVSSNGRELSEMELREYKEMFSLVDKVSPCTNTSPLHSKPLLDCVDKMKKSSLRPPKSHRTRSSHV